jgi:hypothetical protein
VRVNKVSGTVKPIANGGEGYKKLGIIERYDRWAPTYDEEQDPFISLEENITLD